MIFSIFPNRMRSCYEDYQDYPEALETTNRIAERCNVKLEFSQQQGFIPVLVTFPPDISSWQPIFGLHDGATNIQLLEAVMDYVKKRYGYNHAAKIMTVDKYHTRSVFKKVGRVFDMPVDTIYSISDLIPAEHNITMEAAVKKSGGLALAYYGVEFSDENQEIAQAMDFAGTVQNLPHAFVPHPTAFVATRNPLTDYFPMQMPYVGETWHTKNDFGRKFPLNQLSKHRMVQILSYPLCYTHDREAKNDD